MPGRLISTLFVGPFSSNVSMGRTLTLLGEISLTALQALAIYTRNQQFSPLEFGGAYAAILAAGGFAVAKTDAVQADFRRQDRQDERDAE